MYADDSNIYLITTNAVTDPIYNKKDMSESISAKTYIEGGSLLTTNIDQFPAAKKWFGGWLNSEYAATENVNYNLQVTLFMLDSTGVWNNTYRNETYADWAIGSPTYELLAESVNDVQGTTYIPTVKNTIGYVANIIPGGLTNGTVWNRGEAYWLTSNSAYNNSSMCAVYSNSEDIKSTLYMNDSLGGFRPVVCLKSDVKLEQSADETSFEIKKYQ